MTAGKKTTKKSPTKKGASKKKVAAKGKRKPATAPSTSDLKPRDRQIAENFLANGGNQTQAVRDAGIVQTPAAARVTASRIFSQPEVQEYLEARRTAMIRAAQIDTNEIVGTLVSHMRGDLADIVPDDDVLAQARANGVSHLIKEIEITKDGRETKYKIKIHDSQSAAKQLCNVFGLEKLPAPNPETVSRLDRAIERFIEKAAGKGLVVTPEQARDKLMPYFNGPSTH